jgi:hypothetical protein
MLRITNLHTGAVYTVSHPNQCHSEIEREAAQDYLDGCRKFKNDPPAGMLNNQGIIVEAADKELSPPQRKARDRMLSGLTLELMAFLAPVHQN